MDRAETIRLLRESFGMDDVNLNEDKNTSFDRSTGTFYCNQNNNSNNTTTPRR